MMSVRQAQGNPRGPCSPLPYPEQAPLASETPARVFGCGKEGQGEGLRSGDRQQSLPLSLCRSPKKTRSIRLKQASSSSH